MKSQSAIIGLALGTALVGCAAHACAQAYPTKPIRLIVPFASGGGTDIMARVIMAKFDERVGQRVVIENRVGGVGILRRNTW